ncbi:MAG TPA: hypothetical protein VMV62_02060 [Candidatus Paceibacterota bacterium]|nr:hypothetical protein [Candidatus Paceibacterota bacterium]
MTTDTYLLVTFWLSLAGVLFAGYLSAVRLITKECALDRPCPYFLGVPACWYGFGMFVVLFGAAASARAGYLTIVTAAAAMTWVSALGIIFAGSFTLKEVFSWMRSKEAGKKLILPSCAYGLIGFVIILALSLYR